MGTINNAFVLGHLGADPTMRTTDGGTPVTEISIATNRRRDVDGETTFETTWHKVKLWGTRAELANAHLKKGDAVAVGGRINTEEWVDSEGKPRKRTVIVGQQLTLLGGSKRVAA